MVNLNGIRVVRRNDTIFMPLPRELWRAGGIGKCSCGKCDGSGLWDTLAVGSNKGHHTWTVHCPEIQEPTDETVPRFRIGQQFITTKQNLTKTHTITDILRTYNSKGALVKLRYVAEHTFLGQTVTEHDVLDTTIAKGLIE